jgi:N-acyl-D-amino-acid deacylase
MKLFIAAFLFLFSFYSFSQSKYDLIIKNGYILDGTGKPGFLSDIGIRNGKIARINAIPADSGLKVIDAKGLAVSPGFIDVHTHIERFVLDIPTADNFVFDGVTTVITGNCGSSTINFADFFKRMEQKGISINVASLVGHNSVRRVVMGSEARQPTATELYKMQTIVEQAVKEGAVGFSTGLIYTPGVYSKTPEITALAKVVAAYGGVYATHMRDERDSVMAAIREALTVAKDARIPLEISHFKVGGKNNQNKSIEMLKLVENARNQGIDVMVDQYPYTASSTSLDVLLPDWALASGDSALLRRLRDSTTRARILQDRLKLYEKRGQENLDYAFVAYFPGDSTYNGKTITQISASRIGKKPNLIDDFETVMDMLSQKNKGETYMVYHSMYEPDIERIMQYPYTMIASDGGVSQFGKGVPHPRSYGTNARVLGLYVREKKIITPENAIRKMTSLPAKRFGFTDRGEITVGKMADILIFDLNTIHETATYEKPHSYTEGISYVFINGKIVLENGKHTGAKAGQVIRGKGKK